MQRLLEIAIISISVLYVLMHAMEKHVQPLLVTTALLILAAIFKQKVVFAFAFALLLNYLTVDVLESFTDKEADKKSDKESSEETKKEADEEADEESKKESSNESIGLPSTGEFTPDIVETLKKAYENMTPQQIENMTKDTKDLMTSQKQLIETLQTMTPIVKEGMKMMEMFNNLKKKN